MTRADAYPDRDRSSQRADSTLASWCPGPDSGMPSRLIGNEVRQEVRMNDERLHGLLYEALETEQGGIAVYDTAIKCALNDDLRSEWEEYLEQTRHHEHVMLNLFDEIGLDASVETPGRAVVRHIGETLVTAMEMALASGPPEAAQLVAGECVVHAETKDHLNWELLRGRGGRAPLSHDGLDP